MLKPPLSRLETRGRRILDSEGGSGDLLVSGHDLTHILQCDIHVLASDRAAAHNYLVIGRLGG